MRNSVRWLWAKARSAIGLKPNLFDLARATIENRASRIGDNVVENDVLWKRLKRGGV